MEIFRNSDNIPQNKNLVVTFGSFDGVHLGHQKIFNQMKELAEASSAKTMVVTFDPHPRQVVYPNAGDLKLLTTVDEKIEQIAAAGIDYLYIKPFTVEFSQLSANEYVEKFILGTIKPKVLVIGFDHRFGRNRAGHIDLLKQYGDEGSFDTVEISQQLIHDNKVSSTVIRNSIMAHDVERATDLLGRPYSFRGTVIHGEKLGQKLGYRTANLEIESAIKLVPPAGIYAVQVIVEDVLFGGMLYIGTKPTFSDEGKQSVEVHLFDLDQILYGKKIELKVVKYLRDDMSFDSKEALIAQLHEDKRNSLNALNEYGRQKSGANT